jgi:hypothetical protein
MEGKNSRAFKPMIQRRMETARLIVLKRINIMKWQGQQWLCLLFCKLEITYSKLRLLQGISNILC